MIISDEPLSLMCKYITRKEKGTVSVLDWIADDWGEKASVIWQCIDRTLDTMGRQKVKKTD